MAGGVMAGRRSVLVRRRPGPGPVDSTRRISRRMRSLSEPQPVAIRLQPLRFMMKRPWITTVTLGALLVVAVGCNTLGDLRIDNPVYRFREIRPRVAIAIPLSASTIDFNFTIDVENPNSVGLRLDRMDFDLLMNGNRLVSGVSNDRIRIPAQGMGTVQIRTSVGYTQIKDIFREVADLVQGGSPEYQVRGTAYYDTPLGPLSFPLTVYRSGV